jgi:uncharacterized protein (DUF983 family)
MPLAPGTVLKRGFAKRCPVCGEGHLFEAWVRMIPVCRRCGYRFHRKPGQWLGSWFLNLCVVQTAVILVVIVIAGVTWPRTSTLLLIVATTATALFTPLAFFPFSRTIWIAIDLAMKPLDFDDDVPPGWELEEELAALVAESDGSPPDP